MTNSENMALILSNFNRNILRGAEAAAHTRHEEGMVDPACSLCQKEYAEWCDEYRRSGGRI